ncbi:hypothetical protein [Bacteroides thetaiotaomicron]|uniref:hypothetical protein n=1 Tax=Bacteroides thetaiotaomicron TaxID=818 RepID=UPI0039C20FFC
MMKNPNIIFPDAFDLAEVLNECLKRSDLNRFLQTKGIYFFNAPQEEVAKKVAGLFLDYDDLEVIRQNAYKNVSKKVLSGFNLKSNSIFDLKGIYEDLRDAGTLSTKGYTLNTLVKQNISGNIIYKGSISYQSKKPTKMAFLQTEEREVYFEMKEIDERYWQVEIDGCKSSDGKAVQKLLQEAVKGKSIDIDSIDIDKLSVKSTIEFFDELAQNGMGNEWLLDDVARLTFKKKEEEDEEDEEQNATSEQLSGITQAILEGKNLRDNTFVRTSEDAGYIFTAMTYVFSNKTEGKRINIRAEFKGSPKIFEVSLEGYQEKNIAGYEDCFSKLAENENIYYRSFFWNRAKDIFDRLKK